MLLTIDAGNTRTKWAIFDRHGEVTRHGACVNDQLSSIDLSPEPLGYQRVIISNVAGNTHALRLENFLSAHHLPVIWVKASNEACNVINSYIDAETLGTDRWAALIAAWHIKHAACVVVNAGTAVTVDALHKQPGNNQQGEFLGGMILPGLNLMQTSLGLSTAQLPVQARMPDFSESTFADIFAKSTIQAINTGTIHAIIGAIEHMANALEAKCGQTPFIVISGGDAALIQNYLTDAVTNPTVIVDNLVLKGLYLLERSEQ
jgi:type III pantothenate kinase